MRGFICCLLLPTVLLASGCATIVKGTSQTVTVNTDPAGAMCTLTRDARTVAVVNPTPGSVPVGKALGGIAIDCRLAGYQDAAGALAAEFQPMTLGNILLGGPIGIAIDAVSGAMAQYPEAVTITMLPEQFATVAERDAFFDRMRSMLAQEEAAVRDRIDRTCQRGNCDSEREAAQAETQRKLAEIERRRALAKVVESPAALGALEAGIVSP
jgi:uncharacterized protein YceK